MKALIIAPQPFFSPRGTPFSVYYRTLIMAEQGVEIDLLTYGHGDDVDLPGVRLIRIPRMAWLGSPPVGPSWIKAWHDLLMVLWTLVLLLRRRYEFVHAHEEAMFWCRCLKPIFRFKLVYDMHSSLPQQLRNFGFTRSRWMIGLFKKLETTALRHADIVITICPDLERYALRQGVPPDAHFLIENSIFDPIRLRRHDGACPPDAIDGVLDMPAKTGPRVVYAGTFESYQGLDVLINAFARVQQVCAEAQLLLIGGTPEQVTAMRRRADAVGLDGTCQFTGRVSKDAARALLDTADVMVSPRREGTNTPLKIYEQLASGKPLVATNIWSHTQVLNEKVCILVEPEAESMARGLLAAINDRKRVCEVVCEARRLYETAYARDAYERKIRRFLDRLRDA